MMEANIRRAISPSSLARDVGMSTAAVGAPLSSVFLAAAPKRYNRNLRLQKSRNLLMQQDMSVINDRRWLVALRPPSHFLKVLNRAHYDNDTLS